MRGRESSSSCLLMCQRQVLGTSKWEWAAVHTLVLDGGLHNLAEDKGDDTEEELLPSVTNLMPKDITHVKRLKCFLERGERGSKRGRDRDIARESERGRDSMLNG